MSRFSPSAKLKKLFFFLLFGWVYSQLCNAVLLTKTVNHIQESFIQQNTRYRVFPEHSFSFFFHSQLCIPYAGKVCIPSWMQKEVFFFFSRFFKLVPAVSFRDYMGSCVKPAQRRQEIFKAISLRLIRSARTEKHQKKEETLMFGQVIQHYDNFGLY